MRFIDIGEMSQLKFRLRRPVRTRSNRVQLLRLKSVSSVATASEYSNRDYAHSSLSVLKSSSFKQKDYHAPIFDHSPTQVKIIKKHSFISKNPSIQEFSRDWRHDRSRLNALDAGSIPITSVVVLKKTAMEPMPGQTNYRLIKEAEPIHHFYSTTKLIDDTRSYPSSTIEVIESISKKPLTPQRIYRKFIFVEQKRIEEEEHRHRQRFPACCYACFPCCSPCCCLLSSLLLATLLVAGFITALTLLLISETSTTRVTETPMTTDTTINMISTLTSSTSPTTTPTTTTTSSSTTSTSSTTVTTSTSVTSTMTTTPTSSTTVTTCTITSNTCTSGWKGVTPLYHCTNCPNIIPYQQFNYTYTAVSNQTRISFSFREDVGCFALDVVSVRSVLNPGVELIANHGFETGTLSSWTYCNPNGATGAGDVIANSANFVCLSSVFQSKAGNFFYYDGAVTYNDYLSQTFATNIGEIYAISYWLYNEGSGTASSADIFISI